MKCFKNEMSEILGNHFLIEAVCYLVFLIKFHEKSNCPREEPSQVSFHVKKNTWFFKVTLFQGNWCIPDTISWVAINKITYGYMYT